MLQTFDAYILTREQVAHYTQLAADEGAICPNDSYLEHHAGEYFMAIPVVNTMDESMMLGMVQVPNTEPMQIEELPEVLTVSNFLSIVDGSLRGKAARDLLVFIELPRADKHKWRILAERLPKELVNKVKSSGLEYLARTVEAHGDPTGVLAARKMREEAARFREAN